MKRHLLFICGAITMMFVTSNVCAQSVLTYKIEDTGQDSCYDNLYVITPPSLGSAFYGQDAQYNGNQPSFTDNGNGTITDNVTGLMWTKSLDLNGDGKIDTSDRRTYDEALSGADTLSLAGYHDWRLPTIKELYSLIDFRGTDPSGWTGTNDSLLTPFINTKYFDFVYGDLAEGERIIDVQVVSSTKYVSTTMNGNETAFGVNFADGRIKGYPIYIPRTGEYPKHYVRYVRGNPQYGVNKFCDNGDGTVTDSATGLMWSKDDSKEGLNWEDALKWVQQKDSEDYLGHNDWRLPNAKELQSIVDYSRSPATTNSAAIDSVFNCTQITNEAGEPDYPYYWTSTTHINMKNGGDANYIAFGRALGWMKDPFGNYHLLDVHGAGAQRCDPKAGNPSNFPHGRGPQGDVVRIYNYVRLVRNADLETSVNSKTESAIPTKLALTQNYPNPFNPTTVIRYQLSAVGRAMLTVYDVLGRKVATLVNDRESAGVHSVTFDAGRLPSGVYFCRLSTGRETAVRKMLLVK